MDEFFSTQPETDRGDQHQKARGAERDIRAMDSLKKRNQPTGPTGCLRSRDLEWVKQPRDEQGGECRAEIDREIEPAEHPGQQMLVGGAELVADVCADAGFNAAGTQSYEEQTSHQANPRVVKRQSQVTEAINDRQAKDSPILAENGI